MWLALPACVGPAAVTDTGGHLGGFVALAPGPEVVVQPSTDAQTHPALLRGDDGWLVAWDEDGLQQRADARWLDGAGDPTGEVFTLRLTGGAGFTTPDVVSGADGDWFVVLRVGSDVEVGRYRGSDALDGRIVGTGDLGFWTAPDLARVGEGGGELVVAWWDGEMTSGPASYRGARLDGALDPVADEVELAGSAETGSPVAVEPHPAGWVLAWSDGDAIRARLAGPDGAVLAEARVDDAPLDWPPTRPALAVADDGRVVVGWRAQDDRQQGYGTRLRWLDAGLAPLGGSVALGLEPGSTNRIELDAAGDWLAAVWEESTADGDVVLQLFDLGGGQPLTGPMRVHDAVAERQARPTVEVAVGPDGPEVGVGYESGPETRPEIVFRRFAGPAQGGGD
jgi:hypothetical protein